MSSRGRTPKRSASRAHTRKSSSPSRSPNTADLPHETVASWVLFAMRNTLGYEDVRASLLKHFLQDIPGIVTGKTFAGHYNMSELEVYMLSIMEKHGKTVLFTASNLPDAKTRETHYQTFIVQPTKKHVITIDPARTPRGTGIYEPYITETVSDFFKAHGYTVEWLKTSSACQIRSEDVFCQSWSLYLQKEAILHPDTKIQIPTSQADKYKRLLEFYKELFDQRGFCDVFKKEYANVIRTHSALVAGVKKSLQAALRKQYGAVDPCAFLLSMTAADMKES